jgi:probable phosphoglycerate mutase
MILYCIRHGETTFNVEGRLQGRSDHPCLSPLGQRQSEAVAVAIAAWPIQAIYASPLRRVQETATPIARTLGLQIHTDQRLQELDVGVFQGQKKSDLKRLYPAELALWNAGDPDYALPGGESRAQLARRGQAAFREIAASGVEHAAVVSHGGLLIATVKAFLGIPLGDPPLALENCSITRLSLDREGKAELLALNEVAHLEGVGLAGLGDLVV